MNTTPDFDRHAAAWLADGPTELNDRVLDATLAEVHGMRQRRRPTAIWRLAWMSRPSSAAAAGAVAVILIAFVVLSFGVPPWGGIGGPATPTASTTPSPTQAPSGAVQALPLAAEFVSPWYGYRVRYPAGWRTGSGAGPWPLGLLLLPGDEHLDEIVGSTGQHEARLVGASVALPALSTIEDFRIFARSRGHEACLPVYPSLTEPLMIDGAEALITLNGCESQYALGGRLYNVLVLSGGRGYQFTIDGYLTADDAIAWLHAITLEPSAVPPPTTAPSP